MTELSYLLGRRVELESIEHLLAEAEMGHSGSLVLRGEAGIGKTSLLTRARATAVAKGFRTEIAAGLEPETQFAFAGLHQLCAPFLDRMVALPEPQAVALGVAFGTRAGSTPDRFLVGLATLNLLAEAAEEHPLLCLIDDAQWLDEASAQVLAFVARRLSAERVALIFATRTEGDSSTLAGLQELWLGPLGDADARAILASTVRAPLDEAVLERLVAESHGNPLALMELPRDDRGQPAGEFELSTTSPVPRRIEESFLRRATDLPAETQTFLLLAAAESTGDLGLLRRAAERLGLPPDTALPAEENGLLVIDTTVRFHHPLVRSAIYRAASATDARRVHLALAESMDPLLDADRRAWHRAHSVQGTDVAVADDLERLAGRARTRGGLAATAAFLERAAELTPDPVLRGRRALEAAQARYDSGRPDSAMQLLQTADRELLDPLDRARLELLRAEIEFHLTRRSQVPEMLVRAARALGPVDPALSRETYLRALDAVIIIGPGSDGDRILDVAVAARAAPDSPIPPRPADLLLDGLVEMIVDGYEVAVPALRRATQAFCLAEDDDRESPGQDHRWLRLATRTAMTLFDEDLLEKLCDANLRHAREEGVLARLPAALLMQSIASVFTGDSKRAAEMVDEEAVLREITGSVPTLHARLILAAWRGQRAETIRLYEGIVAEIVARGQGPELSLGQYALAVMHNGRGEFAAARAAATRVLRSQEQPNRNLALPELIEAAVRSGDTEGALPALEELDSRARAAATPWALGLLARARGLTTTTPAAEDHYLEAIAQLEDSRMAGQRARTHLVYGEWLRREDRPGPARDQLRLAHGLLSDMGLDAFADRASRELRAAGEQPLSPSPRRADALTAQELHIARLVATGATSREVGAQLFLSPRTIEAHLRNIYRKLGIGSRRQLREFPLS